MISLAPVRAGSAPRVGAVHPPGHGGRGAMVRPEPKPRIPALCALLLVATLLGIVWLTPLGSPSEAVSQVAPPAPPPQPPPATAAPVVAHPDAAAFPAPPEWMQEDLSKQ